MHNNDGPEQVGQEYATDHEHLVVTTPVEGKAFKVENEKVWLDLEDLMLRGLAYAYISHLDWLQSENEGTKVLRAHYEGKSAISQTKAQTFDMIKSTSYSGEKQNWTFEMYVTLHQKSHQIVEVYGKPVSPVKQGQDLIDGITAPMGWWPQHIPFMSTVIVRQYLGSHLCEQSWILKYCTHKVKKSGR